MGIHIEERKGSDCELTNFQEHLPGGGDGESSADCKGERALSRKIGDGTDSSWGRGT